MCTISPMLLLLIFPLCGHALLKFQVYSGSSLLTWKEAQAFCRENHTDLVTFRNEAESELYPSVHGWIGLHRDDADGPWKWSRGDEIANYFNWALNEPESYEHCALKFSGRTKWFNTDCDSTHPFICYDEPLVLVKENKTWQEALNHCRSLGRTGTNSFDLVTMTSEADHDYVRREAQNATSDEVWTGLRFMAGEWLWVSGEEVQYNISSCVADRFCGVLEKNGTSPFGMKNCNERRNFMCYRKL